MKEDSSTRNTTVDFLLPIGKGAVAGTVATIPMTAFMLLMQRALPRWQHYDLPPEKLTDELADRMGVKKYLNKPQKVGLALIAHFAYGAAMGMLYTLLMQRGNIKTFSFLVKGNIFGLAVWGASYLGLLPAMQMSTTAPREPLQRNLLMIAAHSIWGTVLAVTTHVLGD